ncbi:MAG: glycoside hydrolase family 3 N-terminal domain-containing protein [bacterium]
MSYPYHDPVLPIAQRVSDLLLRMTVEEKVGQLRSQMIFNPGTDARDYSAGHVRSLTHFAHYKGTRRTATECAGINNADLQQSIEAHRLGIPVLINEEALHGAQWGDATCFPQSIGLAAMWDEPLMSRVCMAIARELKAVNIHQVFAPVINISRDSRWGRAQESYGEDVYLTCRMALAYVKALEGLNIITSPKHFVDNYAEGGRDSNASHSSWRILREVSLEPFRVCIQEGGARSIMAAYNSIDGVPCTCSPALLTDLLRDEWKFNGFVISDYGGVDGVHAAHHVAVDKADALAQSFLAGLDIELPNADLSLLALVQDGRIPMVALDAATARVLQAKFELGLFDHPYVDAPRADAVVRCPEHRALALEAARKAMVLLKNHEGVLPLRKDLKTLGVFGPAADTVNLGDYSGPYGGWGGEGVSPLAGLRAKVAPGTELRVCGPDEDVAVVARACEVALYFATIREEEGSDRSKLDLPRLKAQAEGAADAAHAIIVEKRRADIITGDQEAEIRRIAATGTKLVVVLVAGSAVTMAHWIDEAAAVLLPWYGGEQGGTAIAEVLFGECNPGGKLPITFPKNAGQSPLYYSYKPSGRAYHYNDNDGKPLFPFGFGLSYATFEYSNLRMQPATSRGKRPVTVSLEVRNTSSVAGDEVVQLYIHDEVASVAVPVKELRGFTRVSLAAGEQKTVTFTLQPRDLALWNRKLRRVVEPGTFEIMVGSSSEDIRLRGCLEVLGAAGRA